VINPLHGFRDLASKEACPIRAIRGQISLAKKRELDRGFTDWQLSGSFESIESIVAMTGG
jgi:hypothetical protein